MDYRPAYMRIAEDIQKSIEQGVYQSGDLIPTQLMLAKQYDVSRITVRDAVNELIHRGLLYTRQGKGTFVAGASGNPYSAVRTGSFSANSRAAGAEVVTKVVELKQIEADYSLACAFELKEGEPVILLSRLRSIDGEKMIFSTSYLPAGRFANIDFFQEDFEKNSLYETLRRNSDLVISGAEEEFRAVSCPGQVASLLDFPEGAPIMYVCRKTYDNNNSCFEWSEQYERTDRYAIRVRSEQRN